jgi:hypothetical protein
MSHYFFHRFSFPLLNASGRRGSRRVSAGPVIAGSAIDRDPVGAFDTLDLHEDRQAEHGDEGSATTKDSDAARSLLELRRE